MRNICVPLGHGLGVDIDAGGFPRVDDVLADLHLSEHTSVLPGQQPLLYNVEDVVLGGCDYLRLPRNCCAGMHYAEQLIAASALHMNSWPASTILFFRVVMEPVKDCAPFRGCRCECIAQHGPPIGETHTISAERAFG